MMRPAKENNGEQYGDDERGSVLHKFWCEHRQHLFNGLICTLASARENSPSGEAF